jgi:hypothetical protein
VSVEFVHVGKYLPQTLGKHYEVPWLVDQGVGDGNRGTFTDFNENSRPTSNQDPIGTTGHEDFREHINSKQNSNYDW